MSERKSQVPQVDVSRLSDLEIAMLIIERDVAQFKAERIDELLNKVGEVRGYVQAEKWMWDPNKITWVETEGTKGLYDKASPQATNDFKAMLTNLKEHNGKLTRDGFFYWVFTDQATVGRKKTRQASSDAHTTMDKNLRNVKEAGKKLTQN